MKGIISTSIVALYMFNIESGYSVIQSILLLIVLCILFILYEYMESWSSFLILLIVVGGIFLINRIDLYFVIVVQLLFINFLKQVYVIKR